MKCNESLFSFDIVWIVEWNLNEMKLKQANRINIRLYARLKKKEEKRTCGGKCGKWRGGQEKGKNTTEILCVAHAERKLCGNSFVAIATRVVSAGLTEFALFFPVASLALAIVPQFFVVHLAVAFLDSNFSVWAWMRHFHIFTQTRPRFAHRHLFFLFHYRSSFCVCQHKLVVLTFIFIFIFIFFVRATNRENRQWISKTNLCFTNALNFLFSPLFFLCHSCHCRCQLLLHHQRFCNIVWILLFSTPIRLFFFCFYVAWRILQIYSEQFFGIWQRQTVLKQ